MPRQTQPVWLAEADEMKGWFAVAVAAVADSDRTGWPDRSVGQ